MPETVATTASTTTQTQSVPLDNERVDYQTFKAARIEGKETVEVAIDHEADAQPVAQKVESDPESGTGKEESGERDEQGRFTGKWSKRVDKLTAEKYELKGKLERAEQELNEFRSKSAGKPAVEVKTPDSATNSKPTPEQFKTYEEFTEALTDWKYEQRSTKAKEVETKSQEEAKSKENFDSFLKRVETFKSTVADYDEVTSNPDIMIPEVAQVAIIESDDGPAIGYYLCQHPDLAAAMLKMSPARQAVEIGRISAKLEAESRSKTSSPEKKPVTSKAPEPIKPVAAGATQSAVPPDQMSQADYKIWFAKNYPNSR